MSSRFPETAFLCNSDTLCVIFSVLKILLPNNKNISAAMGYLFDIFQPYSTIYFNEETGVLLYCLRATNSLIRL